MDLSEEVSLVMNTLSLIYYDLYDLPFINQPEGGRDSLKEQYQRTCFLISSHMSNT